MAAYRLITGRPDWGKAFTDWATKHGYDVQVEDDVDGAVGPAHALLLADDGTKIERFELTGGVELFSKVRVAIKAYADRHPAEAAHTTGPVDPEAPKPEWVACRACGTVHQAAWTEDEVRPGDRTCGNCFEGYFAPCDAPGSGQATWVKNPCLEPAPAKRSVPAHSEVAAAAEPARAAPAGATEQARAARQVGQALGARPEESQDAGAELKIPLYLIDDLPGGNHRKTFDAQKLDDLTALVAEHGVVEPVLVRRDGDRYQLIAGYRRREAARRAGLAELPARIRTCTLEEARIEMLVENQGREDLNPMDEARALQTILNDHPSWSHAELAKAVGKRRQEVGVLLQLTRAPKVIQQMVATKEMAIDTARQFMAETANLSDFVREKVAAAFVKQKPSIRNAPDAIQWAIREIMPPTTNPPAARAATTQQQGPKPDKTAQKPQPSGQNVQQTGSTGPAPSGPQTHSSSSPGWGQNTTDVPRIFAPRELEQTPGTTPAPVTPVLKVDPAAERARVLAEIGRKVWKGSVHTSPDGSADSVLVSGEFYLPLPALIEHWQERRKLGATSMPEDFGEVGIQIPEQGFWVEMGYLGGKPALTLKDTVLTARNDKGGVNALGPYTGNPVYYRIDVRKGAGGTKTLHQQLVIQDGGRHLVLTGEYNVLMRQELVPRWEELIKMLPGMPGS